MTKVILSHSGKQHSYHVAKALDDLGFLERFYTSSYITSRWLQDLIVQSGNKFWSRRFLHGLHGDAVEANWRFELKEILYSRVFGQTQRTLNAIFERDEKFDRYLSGRMDRLDGDIFWGFQGSSLESLKAARRAGKLAVCELSTGHAPAAKRILEEEKNLHAEWADSIDFVSFSDAYFKRLSSEPHEADVVIGASQFTLKTLRDEGVANSKLRYLPLGFALHEIPFGVRETNNDGPIRLLFAGRITQRKGIKYLLDAVDQFKPNEVQLHIIGHVHGSGQALRQYNNFVLHPPLQQQELFKRYQEFDLFVLPSLFEGFGLVILEAMAAGLPVVTTANTIGPELIDHAVNGYIVPIRDENAIVASLKSFLEMDLDQRHNMRVKAREAAMQFSWLRYTEKLKEVLSTIS